ncbi:MAG: hypothetical protein KDI16_06165 [Halioglobus sp.]|nr:hypothetical protein [Halioglobus sp.]
MKDTHGAGARISALVGYQTKLSLERLAAAHGVTQRAMLERMIGETEKNLLGGLSSNKQSLYFAKRLGLHD